MFSCLRIKKKPDGLHSGESEEVTLKLRTAPRPSAFQNAASTEAPETPQYRPVDPHLEPLASCGLAPHVLSPHARDISEHAALKTDTWREDSRKGSLPSPLSQATSDLSALWAGRWEEEEPTPRIGPDAPPDVRDSPSTVPPGVSFVEREPPAEALPTQAAVAADERPAPPDTSQAGCPPSDDHTAPVWTCSELEALGDELGDSSSVYEPGSAPVSPSQVLSGESLQPDRRLTAHVSVSQSELVRRIPPRKPVLQLVRACIGVDDAESTHLSASHAHPLEVSSAPPTPAVLRHEAEEEDCRPTRASSMGSWDRLQIEGDTCTPLALESVDAAAPRDKENGAGGDSTAQAGSPPPPAAPSAGRTPEAREVSLSGGVVDPDAEAVAPLCDGDDPAPPVSPQGCTPSGPPAADVNMIEEGTPPQPASPATWEGERRQLQAWLVDSELRAQALQTQNLHLQAQLQERDAQRSTAPLPATMSEAHSPTSPASDPGAEYARSLPWIEADAHHETAAELLRHTIEPGGPGTGHQISSSTFEGLPRLRRLSGRKARKRAAQKALDSRLSKPRSPSPTRAWRSGQASPEAELQHYIPADPGLIAQMTRSQSSSPTHCAPGSRLGPKAQQGSCASPRRETRVTLQALMS